MNRKTSIDTDEKPTDEAVVCAGDDAEDALPAAGRGAVVGQLREKGAQRRVEVVRHAPSPAGRHQPLHCVQQIHACL